MVREREAIDRPRVQALVLVESAPASALATPDFVAEWVMLAGDGEAIVDKGIRPHISEPVPENVLRRFGENWAKIPRAYLERSLKLVESSFIEQMAPVQLPTLVMAGARDPHHSQTVDAVIAPFPGARLETLNCGAEIPMEMPGELARLIGTFMAELP